MLKRTFFPMILLIACLITVETLAQDSEIIAKVGEEMITNYDLEVRRKRVEAGKVEEMAIMKERLEDQRKTLEEAINLTLLAVEAKKTDVMKNPILKAKIRHYVDALVVQEYLNNHIDALIPVLETEIVDVYKTDPKFQSKEVIRARHILVKTEGEAKEILSKIKAGEDFSKLAKEQSQDKTTGEVGGDLGWFEKGKMVKPFEEAVFLLKEGEVSAVVKTIYGYHIIKLENRKVGPPVELEKVRPEIIKEIKSKKKKEFVSKKLEALKASVPIEILSQKYK